MALDGTLYCPNWHRIRDAGISLLEDTYRCTHERHGQRCNVLLYALGEWISAENVRLVWAVEVTHDEISVMRRLRMTIAEKLAYLQVTWTPAPADNVKPPSSMRTR